MGINGLWDVLGPGQLTSIAALSTEHFKRTGRPFRIPIDEPGWRFNNLNDAQVADIRFKSKRESNPIEKHIFYRLSKLLRLNIQPLFVLDGPSRPWKRGKRGGGKIDYERTRLLIKLLDHLQIPHHRAPAEAEAECAALQKLGIVDAVWSDDGDTLMFGATMLIREHREGSDKRNGGRKSDTHVRIWRARDIKDRLGIGHEDLVVFTLLSGGDYDLAGLRGCGPSQALKVVKWRYDLLAKMLLGHHEYEIARWQAALKLCFADEGINLDIPIGFPEKKVVKNYRVPRVSTEEQLNGLNGLQKGGDNSINEAALRPFMREYFNFWARAYIVHVVPILLVQKLRRGLKPEERAAIDLRLATKKKSKATKTPVEDRIESLETKVTYSPTGTSLLELGRQPDDEDWEELTTKANGVFDPHRLAEIEILDCLLQAGLGADGMAELRSNSNRNNLPENDGANQCTNIATPASRSKRQSPSDRTTNASAAKKRRVSSTNESPTSEKPVSTQISSPSAFGFRPPPGLDDVFNWLDEFSPPTDSPPALTRCSTKASTDQPPSTPSVAQHDLISDSLQYNAMTMTRPDTSKNTKNMPNKAPDNVIDLTLD